MVSSVVAKLEFGSILLSFVTVGCAGIGVDPSSSCAISLLWCSVGAGLHTFLEWPVEVLVGSAFSIGVSLVSRAVGGVLWVLILTWSGGRWTVYKVDICQTGFGGCPACTHGGMVWISEIEVQLILGLSQASFKGCFLGINFWFRSIQVLGQVVFQNFLWVGFN